MGKAHQSEVQELESEQRTAERKKDEYITIMESESQEQGRNLQLETGQVKEYHKLKEKAGKESAKWLSKLDSVNREHKSDQDKLDTENRKKQELETKTKQKGHELDDQQKRAEKLSDHIRSSEQQMEEQEKILNELQGDVGTSKDRISEIQKELEDAVSELGDARVDKHEEN